MVTHHAILMVHRHARIMDELGGAQRLASLLRMKENSVRKWRARGIPARHWHRIVALMPELSAEDLDRTKPRGAQRRYQSARHAG
jgi:hypothetical protein